MCVYTTNNNLAFPKIPMQLRHTNQRRLNRSNEARTQLCVYICITITRISRSVYILYTWFQRAQKNWDETRALFQEYKRNACKLHATASQMRSYRFGTKFQSPVRMIEWLNDAKIKKKVNLHCECNRTVMANVIQTACAIQFEHLTDCNKDRHGVMKCNGNSITTTVLLLLLLLSLLL